MTYKMDFDLASKTGTVVLNVSLIERSQLERSVPLIRDVFAAGYAMGKLHGPLRPGEQVGHITIPEGSVGIGTVCSITLNGVLVAHGIPTHSRFGGLLELTRRQAHSFRGVHQLRRHHSRPAGDLHPQCHDRLRGGDANGQRSHRGQFPRSAGRQPRPRHRTRPQDGQVGLGGLFLIGWPGQSLLDIPVSEGRLGLVVVGGLNPVAILEERGIHVRRTGALPGLIDYDRLFHYDELPERSRELLQARGMGSAVHAAAAGTVD